jgi:hypothetical protein
VAEVKEVDPQFYDRADGFIHLANAQCGDIGRGKVSASFMYGLSRFNAWIVACGSKDAQAMKESRQQTVDYFVEQFKSMLEENLDDYADNFSKYMGKDA